MDRGMRGVAPRGRPVQTTGDFHMNARHLALFASLTAAACLAATWSPADEPAKAEKPSAESMPTVYRWLFGTDDVFTARKMLDQILLQKIAIVDRVCSLTDAQRQ